jgi:hypothetical protein
VKHLYKEEGHPNPEQIISLYHVPLKKGRVISQLCVPMVEDLYDLTYKLWEKVRCDLPAVARAVPPNSCSMLYYHSLFKGKMPRHRDLNLIQNEPTGDQNI